MQFYTAKLRPKQAFLAIAVLLMMGGLRSSLDAQTLAGPTDNELYAAYCAGALTEKFDELASMIGPKPTVESVEQGIRQLSEDLFRQLAIPKPSFLPSSCTNWRKPSYQVGCQGGRTCKLRRQQLKPGVAGLWWDPLIGDCPKREAPNLAERCSVYCPTLVELFFRPSAG